MSTLKPIKDFLRQSRIMFLTCTLVPVSLGGALAFYDTHALSWPLFLLTLLGVSAAHLGVNLSNDYFDFRLGADGVGTDQRPYSGGGGAIIRDKVAPGTVKLWFWSCFAVALAVGVVILLWIEKGRALVLAIMLLGFLGGYGYTAPPLRLAYRGLGELDIFVFLGPAPVLGTYVVQAGALSWNALLCSLPAAGLITALLWINQYTDFATDREAGKRNLVVRLGRKRARWGFFAIAVFVYLAVVAPVALGWMRPTFLLALLTIPLAARAIGRALRYFNDEDKIRGAQADYLMVHLWTGLLCALGATWGALL